MPYTRHIISFTSSYNHASQYLRFLFIESWLHFNRKTNNKLFNEQRISCCSWSFVLEGFSIITFLYSENCLNRSQNYIKILGKLTALFAFSMKLHSINIFPFCHSSFCTLITYSFMHIQATVTIYDFFSNIETSSTNSLTSTLWWWMIILTKNNTTYNLTTMATTTKKLKVAEKFMVECCAIAIRQC